MCSSDLYQYGFAKVLDEDEEFFIDKTGKPVSDRVKVKEGPKNFGSFFMLVR